MNIYFGLFLITIYYFVIKKLFPKSIKKKPAHLINNDLTPVNSAPQKNHSKDIALNDYDYLRSYIASKRLQKWRKQSYSLYRS